ncbi:MAG: nucleotide sugar dehydrogenase [Armatimonadetes bacterium]|nr:nucleotide sugar dehydrogenase [Armatimonadota bacterium]
MLKVNLPLKEKILQKTAKIGVIGLGYVGLPLAIEFAKVGFKVFGIDDNPEKIEKVNQGVNYILKAEEVLLTSLVKEKRIKGIVDYSILKEVDVIIICVPTPLTKNREPDISYVESVNKEISKYLTKGQLIILESTTYPGTTEEVILPKLSENGLKVGEDFYLAFSPERVDPGNKSYNTKNTPKIIGGVTKNCRELTKILYSQVMEEIYVASSPKTAEMVKLLENIFRSVNIALVNELAVLCKKMEINIWEVIDLAATKPYGYMPFYPGPGLGGHCIPIDPFYLTWKAREYDFHTRFIELAGEINMHMPYYIANMLIEALNINHKVLNASKILVLGAAYKKDLDDSRESPSLKIIEILNNKGAAIEYNDDYIKQIKIKNKIFKSIDLKNLKLKNYDAVIIATDHSYYDYKKIVEESSLIIDCRNILKKYKNDKIRVL